MLHPASKTVKDYISELEGSSGEKPAEVRDALRIYVDLWKRAIEKGVVEPGDEIGEALAKIDQSGGLYQAAEG